MALKLLHVNVSPRGEGSISRRLSTELIETLAGAVGPLEVLERDLTVEAPGFVDAAWIEASGTEPQARSEAQRLALAESDRLVAELLAADVLVIATPVYNFGLPAVLKAWIDQVARARITFRYTAEGPVGLLRDKRAYVVMSSGGTQLGGPVDYASTHLRHVLGFLGIRDVTLIAADRLAVDPEGALAGARARIAAAVGQGDAKAAVA